MFFSIDRIEGDVVVLVDDDGNETHANADKFAVPPAEGQMVSLIEGRFVYDPEMTASRRAEMQALLRKVLGQKE